mmetsp:Transcript_12842/g.39985  ORF Transcript_12842/g.39985 Transcript_12842/m.39985 type:complete len:193 (-) Transcript_12842:1798-2376(-)
MLEVSVNAQQDGHGIWAAGGGGAGGSGGSSGDGARPRRPAIDAQAAATMRALCDLAFPHAAPHTHRTNEELLAMCAAWAVSDGGEGSGGSPVPVHRPKEVQRGRLLPTYTKKQKKQKRRMLAGDPVFEAFHAQEFPSQHFWFARYESQGRASYLPRHECAEDVPPRLRRDQPALADRCIVGRTAACPKRDGI